MCHCMVCFSDASTPRTTAGQRADECVILGRGFPSLLSLSLSVCQATKPAKFAVGSRVWLPDEKDAWLEGEVLAINGADLLVSVAKVGRSMGLLLDWRVGGAVGG